MSVPDTNTFNLQNVVDEVNPTTDDLVDCFSDAVAIKFDSTYEGSKDRLLNFRNYGYRDWFLPSYDLLHEMQVNLKAEGVGGFSDDYYWSSSEYDFYQGWAERFSDGYQTKSVKYNSCYVRACRSFTAGIGDYDIGDTGPAGGLICYIDGTTYYEAAPSDKSIGYIWSNIYDAEIGTTETAIGTGQANTTAIIDQDDHTTSAAKLCDDLVV